MFELILIIFKTSMIVEVQADEGLIKLFNGNRQELFKKFKREAFETDDYLKDFIYKNPNSLALLTLEKLFLKLAMLNNGGKVMTMTVKSLDLYDIRHKSKLAKECRKVFSNFISKKLRIDEETTSYIEPENFDPEPYEDFDIELDHSTMESKNDIEHKKEGERSVLKLKSEKHENKKLLQKQTTEPKETFLTKIGNFYKRITSCCRRKPKEQVQKIEVEKTVKLQKGNEEDLEERKSMEFRRNEGNTKQDIFKFNPDEDPNAVTVLFLN